MTSAASHVSRRGLSSFATPWLTLGATLPRLPGCGCELPMQDDLSNCSSRSQKLHRVGDLLHVVTATDHRLKRSALIKLHQLVPALFDLRWIVVTIRSPVKPDHAVVLYQDVIRDEAGKLSAGEADQHQPSFEGAALGAAFADLASNWIIDYIGAPSAGLALDRFHEVFALIIQHNVSAVLANESELVIRADGADDLSGPERPSDLNCREPDSAGGRVNQNRFLFFKSASISKAEVSSLIDERKRCAFFIAHRERFGVCVTLLRDRVLSEPAHRDLRDDALSFEKFAAIGADCFDRAGDFKAGRKRQRRFELIFTGDDQQNREDQNGGACANQNLARIWARPPHFP